MLKYEFAKPNLVLSACLNLQPVRYNGEYVKDETVLKLREYCNIIPVCPEVEIGLGIPRDKIIVYIDENGYGLYQPSTDRELTTEMLEFSRKFIKNLEDVDGFLLKSKSPSCGVSNTSIYKDKKGTKLYTKGKGIFASALMEAFPDLPIEDEGRLRDPVLRDLFLTRLFSIAHWRTVKRDIKSIGELMEFHRNYKYLLMAHSQTLLRTIGRLLAGYKRGENFEEFKISYEKLFKQALSKKTTPGRHINVIMHIYGYFSESLKPAEKKHFTTLIEKFKSGKISIQLLREILKGWAYRFENQYLLSQTYLNPYPEELAY